MNETLTSIIKGAKIAGGIAAIVVITAAASHTYNVIREKTRINTEFEQTPQFLYLKAGYDELINSNPGPTFKQIKTINRLYQEQYDELKQEYVKSLTENI